MKQKNQVNCALLPEPVDTKDSIHLAKHWDITYMYRKFWKLKASQEQMLTEQSKHRLGIIEAPLGIF